MTGQAAGAAQDTAGPVVAVVIPSVRETPSGWMVAWKTVALEVAEEVLLQMLPQESPGENLASEEARVRLRLETLAGKKHLQAGPACCWERLHDDSRQTVPGNQAN